MEAARTLNNVAKLVARAVDLLAVELDNDDRVIFQEFEIRQLHLTHIHQGRIRKEALRGQYMSFLFLNTPSLC